MKALNRKQMEQVGVRPDVIAFFERNRLMGYKVDKLGEIRTADTSDYQDYLYEISNCMEKPRALKPIKYVYYKSPLVYKRDAIGNLISIENPGKFITTYIYHHTTAWFTVKELFTHYKDKSYNDSLEVMRVPLKHIV